MIDFAVFSLARPFPGAVAKEKAMYAIEKTAGQVIAGDVKSSVDAVDQAVARLATLCASIVEVSKASQLPVVIAQGALANAGASLNSVIASRAEIASATRELTVIQRRSNLKETGFGCPPLERGQASEPSQAGIEA